MSLNEELSKRFLDCLEVERREDYEQTAQLIASLPPKSLAKNGVAIVNLAVDNVRTSISGRMVMELKAANVKRKKGKKTRGSGSDDDGGIEVGDLKTGDIVRVERYSPNEAKKLKKLKNSSKSSDLKESAEEEVEVQGVITSVSSRQVNVAVSIDQTTQHGTQVEEKVYQLNDASVPVWIVQMSNEVTYNRMESSMRRLGELTAGDETTIERMLLGESQFVPPSQKLPSVGKWYNGGLNESQRKAIEFNLASNLGIVHGPPGTGKTSTIVELVKQLVTKKRLDTTEGTNRRILICGPSNISVDTILERLSSFFEETTGYDRLVRIGHPARILPQIIKHSLDLIVERDSKEVVGGIIDDIDKTAKQIKKMKRYAERREGYRELKELKKELRYRTKKSFSEALVRAEVVVATLHGSSSRQLVQCISETGSDLFDTLIIDEVSQALEPACWIPLIYHKSIRHLIIAGDNKQLSPTIKTKKDKKVVQTLETTLFDRLLKVQQHPDQFVSFLDTQYRMNEKIMRYPSDALYQGKLVAGDAVKDGKVLDLLEGEGKDTAKYADDEDAIEPIIWYDTEGGDFPEMDYDPSASLASSKYNNGECLVVLKHARILLGMGLSQSDIGIITPYSAQVTKLRQLFRVGTLTEGDADDGDKYLEEPLEHIEISTVDGFQGREKEVIILSLVRSNDKRDVGFLKDFKRLNVSITRCKKQLCVVGDFETIGRSDVEFLQKWCKWYEENDVDMRYVDYTEL